MSIRIHNVSKRYAETPVVDQISLEIEAGEFFVLLGPSGSGKSTLLRMIAGLAPVDSGSVHLHGREVTGLPPRERDIGFVFQSYALFRHLSVADNVEFALRIRGVDKAECRRRREELLELVGLSGFAGRRPWQLSGGQQQRVAIARALAHRPPVLLLDEPFGALDAKIRTELRQTLRRVQRELGLTVVFVTHDQEEAFELADRLGVLNLGRLLEVGRPSDLYLHPRHAFVANFLGAANLLGGVSTDKGVRLGAVVFERQSQPYDLPRPRRVQILFRPEDVELQPIAAERPEDGGVTWIGEGKVIERSFAGSFERLRLRLPKLPAVRPIAPAPPFGADYFWIDALRSQPAALGSPLGLGDEVTVGVRRVHVLSDGALRFVLIATGEGDGHALDLLRQLERRAGALITSTDGKSLPAGDPDDAVDAAVLGAGPERAGQVFEHLLARAPHLLVVQRPIREIRRILTCVAVGEPGKSDVQMAERLAFNLGSEAGLLTVLPEAQRDQKIPEHVDRFLNAGVRVLSARGVEAKSLIRYGQPLKAITAEVKEGGWDLLVVGAPLPRSGGRPELEGLVGELLDEALPSPVLIVRTFSEK
jgi:sulfate transport system ATP-binding protein